MIERERRTRERIYIDGKTREGYVLEFSAANSHIVYLVICKFVERFDASFLKVSALLLFVSFHKRTFDRS